MIMVHQINGAIINSQIINQVKYIQENKETVIPIIDNLLKLLLDQRKHIQESSDVIMTHMEDLNFLKEILVDIANTNTSKDG